jgi:hypothetical protein
VSKTTDIYLGDYYYKDNHLYRIIGVGIHTNAGEEKTVVRYKVAKLEFVNGQKEEIWHWGELTLEEFKPEELLRLPDVGFGSYRGYIRGKRTNGAEHLTTDLSDPDGNNDNRGHRSAYKMYDEWFLFNHNNCKVGLMASEDAAIIWVALGLRQSWLPGSAGFPGKNTGFTNLP